LLGSSFVARETPNNEIDRDGGGRIVQARQKHAGTAECGQQVAKHAASQPSERERERERARECVRKRKAAAGA